jgi:hypothetical protein
MAARNYSLAEIATEVTLLRISPLNNRRNTRIAGRFSQHLQGQCGIGRLSRQER